MLDTIAKQYEIDVIPDPKPEDKVFLRSDHYSFVERGIPALMLLGKLDPGSPSAWLGYISPVVALLLSVIASVVWHLALRRYSSS